MRVLDVCCKAGGVSIGLSRVATAITGVDIRHQRRYPFKFQIGDLRDIQPDWVRENFDFIWLSPPCQFASALTPSGRRKNHINLIPEARALALASGLPYCIENVEGARHHLIDPFMLRGTMFGLGVDVGGVWFQLTRDRYFETNFHVPVPVDTFDPEKPVIGVYGGHARNRSKKHGGRGTVDFSGYSQKDLASKAMGIHHMTLNELSEAIPPKYAMIIAKAARLNMQR